MTEVWLHQGLAGGSASIGDLLEREVVALQEEHRRRTPLAALVFRATGCMGRDDDELFDRELTTTIARAAVAKNRGFADWDAAMRRQDERVDLRFEVAAEAIHWGELSRLRAELDAAPGLVLQRSPFPHHATLIHHVAANGIEISRQFQSPPNAVDILKLLLERGADPDAVCEIYGPRQTTLCLLVSSSVPAVAGVQAALVEQLVHGGAAVNGIDNDGSPLWTAIAFGYTDSVEALARLGARVDNIVFAAALGELALVESYFSAEGRFFSAEGRWRIDPNRGSYRMGANGPTLDPNLALEYALIWAAAHGRREVVEYLLGKNPDLSVVDPVFRATAVEMARHGDHEEVVGLLERAAGR